MTEWNGGFLGGADVENGIPGTMDIFNDDVCNHGLVFGVN